MTETAGLNERARVVDERLADRVYREIRQRILELAYPPGSALVDAEIAAQLGVSRTPVREALVRLAGDGLVKIIARRGAVVTALQREDIRQIYEMIDGLETLAVELIADRVGAGDLGREAVGELAGLVDAMDRALANDDLDGWIEADEEFHRALRRLSGNSYLNETLGRVRDLSERVSRLTLRLRPRPNRSTEQHRQLVAAIEAGDGRRAAALHHEHYAGVRAELTHVLERNALI